MTELQKVLIFLIFWLLILYFIGIRRYSFLFQSLSNGRALRRVISWVTLSRFRSYLSGFMTSFLIQSPYAAQNHIRSFANSGLLNTDQMCFYLIGSFVGTILAAALFLFIPTIPTKILIAILLVSFFYKLFFAKYRFFVVNLAFVASASALSILSIKSFNFDFFSSFPFLEQPLFLFASGFFLVVFTRSILFTLILAGLFFQFGENLSFVYMFVGSMYLGFVSVQLAKSTNSNRLVKVVFTYQWLIFTLLIMAHYQWGVLDIGSSMLSSLFNDFNFIEKMSFKNYVSLIFVNSVYLISYSVLSVFLFFLLKPFLNKMVKGSGKPKEMQKLIFPRSRMFYSPFLYIEHLRYELKKLSAMVQTSLQGLVDLSTEENVELSLRVKKYNLILLKIREEIRRYSYKSLNKIKVPYTNQENLHLLQMSESLEKISNLCTSLLDKEIRQDLSKEDHLFLVKIVKNYEYVFEAFTADSRSIYPSHIDTPKVVVETTEQLVELNYHVQEYSNALMAMNTLRAKTSS